MKTADVVVLGAGPAGLAAAYRAASMGRRVVVLEQQGRVGGAAGSFEVAGVRVDHGSHRLHPSTDPVILAELRGLLGDHLQRRERHGRIRLAGRWIAFPLRAPDLVRHLPPSFAVGAAWDVATSWARRARAETFAERLRAGLGPTICEHFYFPYARKLWGLAPDEISAEQARVRVSAGTSAKLLRRLVPGRSNERQGGFFYYPRRGFGEIAERLADAAVQAGADIRLRCAASRVGLLLGGVRVETADGDEVEAQAAWSTLPLTVLMRFVDPPPPEPVLAAARGLTFRSMLLVYLVLPTSRYTPFDAHYLPDSSTPVSRISEPKNYRAGDDPSDRTVLCAEIPCELGGDLWKADDTTLGDVVTDALARCRLPAAKPSHVEVRRLPHAYPIYRVGYEPVFAALDDWVAGLPQILSFGRQGLFVHDNSHHALAMGWAAAAALGADGRFDQGGWAAARARFAEHTVED